MDIAAEQTNRHLQQEKAPPTVQPQGRAVLREMDGQARVIIENVKPEIDGGRFPVKRVIGDNVTVYADIFADGHNVLSAVVRYRHETEPTWTEARMQMENNDRWAGSFPVPIAGIYFYSLVAWVDHFRSWRRDLEKKFAAGIDVELDLELGRELLQKAALRAGSISDRKVKETLALLSKDSDLDQGKKVDLALAKPLLEIMDQAALREHASSYPRELAVQVEQSLARFSAWYELFPRSCSTEPGRHGTLRDCAAWLPRIAEMGFDIIYLPPIHPIGTTFRKGKNNQLSAVAGDPGSPWAIGSHEGGHKAIHAALGTLADFRQLVAAATEYQLEVALDIAFQCSPDHPYVREHPEWFRHRPDGCIQYAENPPKKYQDIYPLDFESANWIELWKELKSIFEFWMEQGVRVFRVDNPHTKSFRFWEWCLNALKRDRPDLIFLSEAFTRPKLMYYLAKLGFTQSYNYFPWRNTKHELTEYFTELARTELREFFRSNLWPNTPDILTEYLQCGGRAAFLVRLILAATLGANYGVYGPPYELCESAAREPGSEEYLNSEKYELRYWEPSKGATMRELMTRLNAIRRQNAALQSDHSLEFHDVDNEHLIAYSKHTENLENIILSVVNLDPRHAHRGWLRLDTRRWGLKPTGTYQVHELLTNERYLWSGDRHYIELNPSFVPAHIFLLRRYVRTEHEFDYFV